jgi:hypothetical protein
LQQSNSSAIVITAKSCIVVKTLIFLIIFLDFIPVNICVCIYVCYVFCRVPEINIITDIICGFPTENEADFEETMDLCSKFRFASLFINQFFPRPGTPAGK